MSLQVRKKLGARLRSYPCRTLGILCAILLTLIIQYSVLSVRSVPPIPVKSRLRPQNRTSHTFVKFRHLGRLTSDCESLSTIDCLTYLHQNRSDYFEELSSDERQRFQAEYCTNEKRMLFHTFWNDPNRLGDPFLQLHIHSYLFTQNHQCSKLILWTISRHDGDLSIDPKYQIYGPYVEIRTLSSFAAELDQVGIRITRHWSGLPWRWFLPPWAIVSDAVRFVVLNKLGGIYVDIDVLFLRDFQPLFAHEFAYRWPHTKDFNTAVLRLLPQSETSELILSMARLERSAYAFYPTILRSYSLPSTFQRLPCAFFDPLWLAADSADPLASKTWKLSANTWLTFRSSFKRSNEISRRGRSVFDGAFAFHWHSLKKAGMFQKGSLIDQWNDFLNRELYRSPPEVH